MFTHIIDLIYPPICEVCSCLLSSDETYLCKACLGLIKLNAKPFCVRCGRSVGYIDKTCSDCSKRRSYNLKRVLSWGLYDTVLRRCVHLIKYQNKAYILDIFKESISTFIKDNYACAGIDLIIPVPLSSGLFSERRFNQSLLIANLFLQYNILVTSSVLYKKTRTRPQHTLSAKERVTNVRGVFSVKNKHLINGKRILLVDDVLTTGATLNECSKTLFDNGAKEVSGFTLARGL